jgi:hypothetical protein
LAFDLILILNGSRIFGEPRSQSKKYIFDPINSNGRSISKVKNERKSEME